ncbi:hypothetical protein R1flu_017064 [Riccia fluitans]|uniref:Uncharacterized protein n=1 Tax=Riccia fluitans TaxID=41844 RepID=A0ABD1YP65_9MARC
MCQYPSASSNPNYDAAELPDDYCKFFLPGVARVRSKDLGEVVAATLWKVPSTAKNYSSPLDKIPSSLWNDVSVSPCESAIASSGCCCDNEANREDSSVIPSEITVGRDIFWPYKYCLDE